MLERSIARRILLTPLANNGRGKTGIIRAMVRQGERRLLDVVQRGVRRLHTPWGREVDALVIGRSYQETLAEEFGSVVDALGEVDGDWRSRDLVVLPSHLVVDDCNAIVEAAHGAGFDAVVVSVVLDAAELEAQAACLRLGWDERWTLMNDRSDNHQAQVEALGHDLWTWVGAALTRQ